MRPNARAGEESLAQNGAASPETIQVCPECDRPSVAPLTKKPNGSHRRADTEYRCRKCGAHFDDPEERERRGNGGRSGLSGKLADPEFTADDLVTDGGEDYPFQYDPRDLDTQRCPSVVEELTDQNTGTTSKVSFAHVEVRDGGVLRCIQYDGRVCYLPEWRWTEVSRLETERFTTTREAGPAEGWEISRNRIAAEDWQLLPEEVREVVENPHEKRIMTDGGEIVSQNVLTPEQAGDRDRLTGYRAVCEECETTEHIRETEARARSDAEAHNRRSTHASIGMDVREVEAVRLGNVHLKEVRGE
jgi:DNA-directed RNA polymerase subunit M/transcription elongation factor TFIIS